MNHSNRKSRRILSSLVASTLLMAAVAAAQVQPVKPAAPTAKPTAQMSAANAQTPNEKDIVTTQMELIKLLRLSPKLTTVIEHDPSLLANQAYVESNNPQLGQFLTSHPEIARNPEFYLFTHMNGSDGSPDEALDRAVWPEMHQQYHEESATQRAGARLHAILRPLPHFWVHLSG